MQVKLSKATEAIFKKISLEAVYHEAVANALDAYADKINIAINIKDCAKPKTLSVEITDNGEGFTGKRFEKFNTLYDTEDAKHKGLGRLAYLCYFEKVLITSTYNNSHTRTFEFSETFKGKSKSEINNQKIDNGTKLIMSGYILGKVYDYDYMRTEYLKESILTKFYPRLFKSKREGKQIEITISSTIGDISDTKTITANDIPDFKLVTIGQAEHRLDLYSQFEIYYHIEQMYGVSKVITAMSIDDRTFPINVIDESNFPPGYKIVFLMYSDYFMADDDRETVNIHKREQVEKLFTKNIAKIINEEIPQIAERNQKQQKLLTEQYPHLNGYFDSDCIGYTSRDKLLEQAQSEFFKEQRKILDAETLTPEQFEESLKISARTLAEYILFRQNIIKKLKDINKDNAEFDIHNLIIPRYEQFDKADFDKNLYRNNVWVLDDKYMTYDTILSDKEMSEVIKVITENEDREKSNGRPDIAMFFSGDPNKQNDDGKVDVVIVELKKKGITLEENMKVITQLEKRARDLMKYYKNKIQRIWFYGVIEFNEDVELHLSGEYKELYSTGKMYYREIPVAIQKNPNIILPIGVFISDLDSIISDADCRNSVFLNLIKSKFIQNPK